MLRNLLILLIFLMTWSVSLNGQRVQAKEHVVIILNATYFPEETAVAKGDVVRFVNNSGQEHTIMHADGHWATMAIKDRQEILVEINDGMAGPFYGEASHRITGRLHLIRVATPAEPLE